MSDFLHDARQKKFTLDWQGHTAWIDYDIRSGVWHLLHAQVPQALRGQGVGQVLVEKTLRHLRTEGIAFVPVCTYIQALLERNPELGSTGGVS